MAGSLQQDYKRERIAGNAGNAGNAERRTPNAERRTPNAERPFMVQAIPKIEAGNPENGTTERKALSSVGLKNIS
jgi:hypothetical protein